MNGASINSKTSAPLYILNADKVFLTLASGMAQTFSSSEQGVVAVNVGNQSAGTQITLEDLSGNTIISYEPELPFAVVILSTPDLVKGETYALAVGSLSGDITAS